MEPKCSAVIPHGHDWMAQVKWDGVRVLTYFDGLKTKLYNRKKNDRTLIFPELTDVKSYLNAESAILDGEVVAMGPDGKPSFHEVMRRDGLRRLENLSALQKAVPIFYLVFDLLFYNDRWLLEDPLETRLKTLAGIIVPGRHVRLVESHPDGETLFQAVSRQGMEGIVTKRRDSVYRPGQKIDCWLKIKDYQDLIAVIGGYTTNGSAMNSLLLGLYDDSGSLIYVGQTGSGKLSQNEWGDLEVLLKSAKIRECPFADKKAIKKEAFWIRPLFTVKVQFAQWTPVGLMRQPVLQAVAGATPQECRSN